MTDLMTAVFSEETVSTVVVVAVFAVVAVVAAAAAAAAAVGVVVEVVAVQGVAFAESAVRVESVKELGLGSSCLSGN